MAMISHCIFFCFKVEVCAGTRPSNVFLIKRIFEVKHNILYFIIVDTLELCARNASKVYELVHTFSPKKSCF